MAAKGKQLMVFLVQRVGMRDAVKVGTFLVQWGQVARSLGREPTKEEFCVHWHISLATYYRDWNRFLAVWPGEVSPQSKWEWVEANVPIAKGSSQDEALLDLLLAEGRP